MEFCKQVGAGGNHLVAVTAGGKKLGADTKHHLYLREKELAPILAEFRALPEAERKASIGDPKTATPPKRPVPDPPQGGIVIRGYCTYLKSGDGGQPVRAQNFYYKKNPDRWLAETQSDMLWLTAAEWKALLPAELKPGSKVEVAAAVKQRFFGTIGIDYMEGSVNALEPRDTQMTIAVQNIQGNLVTLQLDGYGEMGKELSATNQAIPKSRGCAVRVSGKLVYDTDKTAFTRFDLVGIGKAWGNKMEYTRREIGIEDYPWMYGIACELVTGDSAIDRIPPYNLLHYGSAVPYFSKK